MKLLPVIAAASLTLSITAQAAEKTYDEARQLVMAAYDTSDPKVKSALFVPDAMVMGFNGGPVVQGHEAIECAWAGTFKNMGCHYTIVIKDVVPVGSDVVVANDELEIRDVGLNHDTIHGRAVITLAKTPDGWRYVSIAAQKLTP